MSGAPQEGLPGTSAPRPRTCAASTRGLRGTVVLVVTLVFLAGVLVAIARLVPGTGGWHPMTWLIAVRAAVIVPPLLLLATLAARFEAMPRTVAPGALLAAFGLTLWMTFQLAAVWLRMPAEQSFLFDPVAGVILIAGVTSFLVGSVREAERLRRRSERDSLTGLFNREGATSAWNALPPHTSVALAVVDLNELKVINDRCGHTAGDTHLRACANALARASLPLGWAARWGGDEFLVAFPHHSEAGVRKRLRYAARHAPAPQGDLPLWAIGVTLASTNQPLHIALEPADAHMYADKAQHREAFQPASGGAVANPGPAVYSGPAV